MNAPPELNANAPDSANDEAQGINNEEIQDTNKEDNDNQAPVHDAIFQFFERTQFDTNCWMEGQTQYI